MKGKHDEMALIDILHVEMALLTILHEEIWLLYILHNSNSYRSMYFTDINTHMVGLSSI